MTIFFPFIQLFYTKKLKKQKKCDKIILIFFKRFFKKIWKSLKKQYKYKNNNYFLVMNNKIFQVFIRVFALTSVFFVLINVVWYVFNVKDEAKASTSNKEQFTSNDIEIVWNVWVAIATNIWTRQKSMSETPVTVYKDVMTISQIIWDSSKAQDQIITSNMLILNEYLNVLKTDVKSLLNASNDRSATLNAFISQLEYRYKAWIENANTLKLQKAELTSVYNASARKLDTAKANISTSYWKLDTKGTLENIDEYLKVTQEYNYARTYIVFINKFLNSYAILNNYNKLLLDTLINNKEILIKNTQVVIPDSWSNLLKKLDLIYDESDFKEKY